jgi:hypothetical protein
MNSELSYSQNSANVEPEQAPRNLISRLTGVWFSPRETFVEIGRVPRALIPTLLLIALVAMSNYLLIERYGFENIVKDTINEMVDAGYLPPDKAGEAIQQSMAPAVAAGGKFQICAIPAISILIAMLIMAAFFRILAAIIGAQGSFKQIYSVTAYAFLAVSSVHTAILLISTYLKDPVDLDMHNPLASNLGALAPMMVGGLSKFVIRLLSYVDVFVVWRLVILAVGYSAVTRKMKTGVAAGLLAALHIIGAVIVAIIASQFD